MLVHNYLSYFSRNTPDLECLTVGGETLTYGDMEQFSNQVANGLRMLGVEVGQRVAILGENSREHVITMFAASKTGAVFTPLNHRLAPRELAYIITDANITVMIVTADMEQKLDQMRDSLPEDIIVISETGANALEITAWMQQQSPKPFDLDLSDQAPFLQLYTSGTTGVPKGVVSSHYHILNTVRIFEVTRPVSANQGDANILSAPLFHIAGLAWVLVNVCTGVQTLLHRDFNPERVVTEIEQYATGSAFMVPAMIMAILNIPGIETRDFSQLKQIFYGAAPITEPILRRAIEVFDCEFVQNYGMTETTGTVITLTAEDHHRALQGAPHLLRSCGRASLGVQLKIVNSDGEPVPTGEIGEILVKSPTNMLHYHNQPEETRKTLVEGWIHTGDAGYSDADGFIYLKDRIKDMVVSGGENIYPVEVENTLIDHQDIQDVAVIGVPNEKFGEALLAFVVLKKGRTLDSDGIIEFCRDRIAGYKIPRQFQAVDEIPRNPSGKVLKKDLRKPYWSN